jgi:hypothetical protein
MRRFIFGPPTGRVPMDVNVLDLLVFVSGSFVAALASQVAGLA